MRVGFGTNFNFPLGMFGTNFNFSLEMFGNNFNFPLGRDPLWDLRGRFRVRFNISGLLWDRRFGGLG